MRYIVIVWLVGFLALLVACSERGPRPGAAKLVFINHTDSNICYGGNLPEARHCSERIEPDARKVSRPECLSGPDPGDSYPKGLPLNLQLAVENAEEIYAGSARCEEETTFVIANDGDKIIVAKSVTQALENEGTNPKSLFDVPQHRA